MSAVYATSASKSEKGGAIGIIGANGAGKSTLLALVAGAIGPARRIDRGSRAGGTPSRVRPSWPSARSRPGLDEPIRTYSSGMVARLGFSVAVHLDPEILLIDEIFAVGGRSLPGPVL